MALKKINIREQRKKYRSMQIAQEINLTMDCIRREFRERGVELEMFLESEIFVAVAEFSYALERIYLRDETPTDPDTFYG